jgi:16S rRNA (uracil1498-N3)-methyltransferase
MIFLFCDDAGKETLSLRSQEYKYLIKVRRHKEGDTISLRSPKNPEILYSYVITHIEPKKLTLTLQQQQLLKVTPLKNLHIGWCVIDPKSVEKVLPSLNEMGVGKISFIYCDRSQKNFRIDTKRLERILLSSMQQCGRSSFMEFEIFKTLSDFLQNYPQTIVLDFSQEVLPKNCIAENVLIGCEGGFSEKEKELLSTKKVYRFETPLVLKSESAATAIAAKILL